MSVKTTGNHEIDSATAEIAMLLRDANPGQRDQHYYDGAMELRDRILSGARELAAGPVFSEGQPVQYICHRVGLNAPTGQWVRGTYLRDGVPGYVLVRNAIGQGPLMCKRAEVRPVSA